MHIDLNFTFIWSYSTSRLFWHEKCKCNTKKQPKIVCQTIETKISRRYNNSPPCVTVKWGWRVDSHILLLWFRSGLSNLLPASQFCAARTGNYFHIKGWQTEGHTQQLATLGFWYQNIPYHLNISGTKLQNHPYYCQIQHKTNSKFNFFPCFMRDLNLIFFSSHFFELRPFVCQPLIYLLNWWNNETRIYYITLFWVI